ncbi:interleukin-18-like isoform X1 [Pogoniulus pusillus]|uniref:interleukin-18-like isoform X1 n=1 Tax=Pogoniulus pusillus TaxID=488313 RepID=UPI0030B982A5
MEGITQPERGRAVGSGPSAGSSALPRTQAPSGAGAAGARPCVLVPCAPVSTRGTSEHTDSSSQETTPLASTLPFDRARVKMSSEEILVYAVKLGENFCLYFEGLECDAFCKEKTLQGFLRNVNSQLLVARPDMNCAAFEDVTDQEIKSGNGMQFNIHCYKTTTPSAGMPVAFSVHVADKSYYLCCEKECGKMMVRFREGKVPEDIPGESNIIFFKRMFTSCSSAAFKFEYSLERGMFLAFEEEGSLRKLTLKKLSREDEVDETMKLSF